MVEFSTGEAGHGARAATTDSELLARAQAGDYSAFEQVVQRYHDKVYRLSLGITQSAQDAEEVTQETFLSMFRSLASFRHQSAPSSWIYRIAINTSLMRLRQHRRKPQVFMEDQAQSALDSTAPPVWPAGAWSRQPDDKLMSKELTHRIEAAINKLPEKYRLVLLLRDVEGQSNEVVADTLGLTLPTVKSRLHRSRLFVRQELDAYFKSS